MKAIKMVLGVLVLMVALVLVGLVFWGGRIAKHGVEHMGPQMLGVPVTVERVRFQPLRGRFHLSGLVVGNPEGFSTEQLFELRSLDADVQVRSLFSDPIVIDRILIDAPHITYEIGLRGSNLGALLEHLESEADDPPDPGEGEPSPEASGPQVVIRELILGDVQVHVSAPGMGGQVLPIRLSTIRLTDLGGEDQSPRQITTEVLRAVLSAVVNAVSDVGGVLGDGLRSAGEGARAAGDATMDGLRSATDAAGESVRSLRDSILRPAASESDNVPTEETE